MQRNYYRPAPYPNLMRRRIRTAGNRSMGGGTSNPFAAARLANRTQQARRPPGSGRHMSPNAMLNVRPTLRRCNLGNEKGPDTSTRGATSWFTKPLPSVTRSPGPKGSSAQLPTPPGISLSEPSRERPLVDTHYFSPVREALFNTLRKDVHRGQKDSVIGT
ncbi:hypothetical protein ISN45_Un97g000520 (mitochondrion) [Arabidopsis thaliana x Arabidopsis arenosa]|uniref:Uncharacterized protein n=1 Tax=Arabidopsis thaliana x Arabidopsis arenosa TaxID=1240361 RepID=A0A8T1XHT9_9BRAS|nr:hypothetical protein ISN45_Un97g000520 [Arabidopsis thaliana x Arabidopsis arenosa]